MGKRETGELLYEGMRSYFDALGAVKVFQREVVSTSRKVLEQTLGQLSAAFGHRLKASNIKPAIWPDEYEEEEVTEGPIWIGAYVPRSWNFYVGLYLDRSEGGRPRVLASASIDGVGKTQLVSLSEAVRTREWGDGKWLFSATKPKAWLNGGEEVVFSLPVPPDAVSSYPRLLRAVTRQWVTVAKKNRQVRNILRG